MNKGIFRKRNLGLFIKVLIAFVALWFLYREVQIKNQESDLSQGIDLLLKPESLIYLLILLVLMLLNWSLEAYKWKTLIQHIENISLLKSLKAIFSGITIAIFTPYRVGEYFGRVFHLGKADRFDATLLTVVGSYAQLVVTLVAGILASIFFIPKHIGLGPVSEYQYYFIALLMFGLCVLLVVLFLNTRLLTTVLNRLPIPKKYHHYIQVFDYHNTATLLKVFLASVARYLVFTFQFYLLLQILNVEIRYDQAMMMIGMTYFAMTVIPTPAVVELVTRSGVALLFFGYIVQNTVGIVVATSMLWLINLAIPALIGVLFIFQLRFFRKSD